MKAGLLDTKDFVFFNGDSWSNQTALNPEELKLSFIRFLKFFENVNYISSFPISEYWTEREYAINTRCIFDNNFVSLPTGHYKVVGNLDLWQRLVDDPLYGLKQANVLIDNRKVLIGFKQDSFLELHAEEIHQAIKLCEKAVFLNKKVSLHYM